MDWQPLLVADPLTAMELAAATHDAAGITAASRRVAPEDRGVRFWRALAARDRLLAAAVLFPNLDTDVALCRLADFVDAADAAASTVAGD